MHDSVLVPLMKTLEAAPSARERPARRLKFPGFVHQYRHFIVFPGILLCSVLSYLLISQYIMMTVEIKGVSMTPTLLDGERFILYRCPYLWRTPRKREIVVIRDPEDHGLSIKRIVALPGETVEIRPDGVFIDNHRLAEPYLTSMASSASGTAPVKPVRLGRDDYFLLGDNRSVSADSRTYGPVPRNYILGLISK